MELGELIENIVIMQTANDPAATKKMFFELGIAHEEAKKMFFELGMSLDALDESNTAFVEASAGVDKLEVPRILIESSSESGFIAGAQCEPKCVIALKNVAHPNELKDKIINTADWKSSKSNPFCTCWGFTGDAVSDKANGGCVPSNAKSPETLKNVRTLVWIDGYVLPTFFFFSLLFFFRPLFVYFFRTKNPFSFSPLFFFFLLHEAS